MKARPLRPAPLRGPGAVRTFCIFRCVVSPISVRIASICSRRRQWRGGRHRPIAPEWQESTNPILSPTDLTPTSFRSLTATSRGAAQQTSSQAPRQRVAANTGAGTFSSCGHTKVQKPTGRMNSGAGRGLGRQSKEDLSANPMQLERGRVPVWCTKDMRMGGPRKNLPCVTDRFTCKPQGGEHISKPFRSNHIATWRGFQSSTCSGR